MAQDSDKWNEGWRNTTWASARGLWKRPTLEESEADDRSWCEAACEAGGLFRVLWCELCQLIGDLLPYHRRKVPTPDLTPPGAVHPAGIHPSPAPEQAEG